MNVQVHDSNCGRSEEHTSELQSHSEISYAVFCLKKKKRTEDDTLKISGRLSQQKNNDFASISSSFRIDLLICDALIILALVFFFFNDTATTEIYTNLNTLSLHDALPICTPDTFRNLVSRILLVTGV